VSSGGAHRALQRRPAGNRYGPRMSDDGEDNIVVGRNPELPGDRRRAVRWVQYTAPLFVRVQPDEDGWGTEISSTEISKVVLVVDPEDIHPERDDARQFLVYDESFQRIDNLDLDVRLDGIRDAVSVAEDRHRWPEGQIVALGDDWEVGPDPRHDPVYYLSDVELAECYPDDE